MKLILTQVVEKLGKPGDIVNVKDGYARNFLLPTAKAIVCTVSNQKRLEEKRRLEEVKLQKEKEGLLKLKEALSDISCTIAVTAGDSDKIYGSVTNGDIAEALKQEGFEIDKKKIILDKPIDALGVYKIGIKLHTGINADVKVWVVRK